ncbi:hypothetical protein C0R09_01340 [Brevibacillus laterosporus]|uniref:hypothetical protein n=1 Tax=Brevibacillus laterosporus TaxID=1465 RepID=UPI000C790DE3|nr:hypothetical protein [Brevibacillus laterosporus]AUM63302.1 hypothetical protein C0R09_01340 [Brevibacillus laterosporus]
MQQIWSGFAERVKRLNPLWTFGRGMRLGELDEYKQNILLAVLLEVFYRELNDDPRRTRQDLLDISRNVIQLMNLEAEGEQYERLVNGLLFSGTAERQLSFKSYYYDEESGCFDSHEFRYLENDRVHSRWYLGGKTVYKLTEASQELIFISREIVQEFSIAIEQLYNLQLIRQQKFSKAASSFDSLISRVKKLFYEEHDYQEEIKKNPRHILFRDSTKKRNKESEVRAQFAEEKERFESMVRLLNQFKGSVDYMNVQEEIDALLEKIEYTRQLHDKFAVLYVDTFALELRIRKHTGLLIKRSHITFKQHIFENIIVEQGVHDMNVLSTLLAPLFSPKSGFKLPLEWLWKEHENIEKGEAGAAPASESRQLLVQSRTVNWDKVTECWGRVFDHLLSDGEFSLEVLRQADEELQVEWLDQVEAFELWMQFGMEPLYIVFLHHDIGNEDERLFLLRLLAAKNDDYKKLVGKWIVPIVERDKPKIQWYDASISSIKLVLKERV